VVGQRAIAHHGAHSGYGRLPVALRAKLPVREVGGGDGTRVPSRLARRLIARTDMPWYDGNALEADLGVTRALWRGEVCHPLYGEDTMHYSALSRRLRAPGRLVVTFHQPPAVFDEVMRDRRPLPGIDAAIAMSSELREHLSAYLGRERAFFVPLGVDTSFFRPPAAPRPEPLSCLFVGWWQRDLDVLAAVVRRVCLRLPSVRFEAVVPEWTRAEVKAATGIEPLTNISDGDLLRSYQRAAVVVLPLKAGPEQHTAGGGGERRRDRGDGRGRGPRPSGPRLCRARAAIRSGGDVGARTRPARELVASRTAECPGSGARR